MGILMAGLSPHPPLIIPEIGGKRINQVNQTVSSLEELSQEVKEKDPDLLITISPHGPVFRDAISVLDQSEPTGDFGEFGHPEITFSEKSNLDFIKKLQDRSLAENIELITLSEAKSRGFNSNRELDHGVMVPLHYLKEAGLNIPIIALTMGLLDYKDLYDFGLVIQQTLKETGQDGVVIASGDLSHRLNPGAPAGYNPRGEEFDEKLVNLLKEERFEEILDIEPQLIKKAGECGLRPIVMMLGSMRGLNPSSDVKSYEGPFGVGYAVAGIYRKDD